MKPLNQDDLYQNLQVFLKGKGIDLQQGSYARGIQKSCSLLTDAINLGQQGLDRAKAEIDKKLDQMRQVIHEKTAPRKSAAAPPKMEPTPSAQAAAGAAKTKSRARRKTKSRKARS